MNVTFDMTIETPSKDEIVLKVPAGTTINLAGRRECFSTEGTYTIRWDETWSG